MKAGASSGGGRTATGPSRFGPGEPQLARDVQERRSQPPKRLDRTGRPGQRIGSELRRLGRCQRSGRAASRIDAELSEFRKREEQSTPKRSAEAKGAATDPSRFGDGEPQLAASFAR